MYKWKVRERNVHMKSKRRKCMKMKSKRKKCTYENEM